MNFFVQKEGGRQERQAFHVTCGYPKLRRPVPAFVRQDADAGICQGVHEVEQADKEKGDADNEQVWVNDDPPTVPGDNKNGTGDDDGKKLAQGVKQQKTVEAGSIDAEQRYAENNP